MSSSGKIFEADFKNSVPKTPEYFYYRFKDNASSFAGGDKTRFTTSNISDCMVMTLINLFLLELKTHAGASIPFSCIRKNQIVELAKVDHPRVKSYFILNYRDKEFTCAIPAKVLKEFMDSTTKKSIPLVWAKENGIEIIGTIKISRYKYNLEEFFTCVNNA